MAYAAGGVGHVGSAVGIVLVLFILLVIITKPWFV